jgi:LuxR family maltose regulon positive regulatory protein
MEILRVLAHGRSNKEIARALDVGLQTVKWHMKNLLAKLGAANRRHAVDRARLLGILD